MKNYFKGFAAVACGALMLVAAGCGGGVSAKVYKNPDVTVTAGEISSAKKISEEIFGIFLEDINYASQVMDDNLVANGNFESLSDGKDVRFSDRWAATSGATMEIGDSEGVLAAHADYRNDELEVSVNPHYAKVTVNTAGGGIANSGYRAVPMAVKSGEEFAFSAFVRAGTAANMTVRVTDGSNEVLSSAIAVSGDEWIKYVATVKASGTASENLRLELTFDKAGTYYVDAVALETKNATLGIKNYIYEAIRDLSPKFMRFPGGCIIEGDAANGGADCVEVYDWKNSVGAVKNGEEAGDDIIPAFTYKKSEGGKVEEVTTYGEWTTRTNNYDLWGYNMDYGLGFYDYFLLCDAIGASPVPILNCGFSDQGGAASVRGVLLNGRHGQKVADYIADAMDLVAFANGDVNSSDAHEKKWAQFRVAMGHEKPFGMKYLGVGNEQFGSTYFNCYQQFVEAFQEAAKENAKLYGGIQLIVGNGMVFSDCEYGPSPSNNVANNAAKAYKGSGNISKISEYGMVDHHYYMGYADFLHYATPEDCIYDKYSRDDATRYDVFVGEYSANNATRYYSQSVTLATEKNAWVTALSEAAYMTALERNGDVIKLAAYAPMFGAVDDKFNQWAVDMMYYTNTKLVRSANYYVQQLFMQNAGTHFLNSKFEYSETLDPLFTLDDMYFDRFYQAVTYDEKTGDIILKLVNADNKSLYVNVDLSGAAVKSKADAVILEGGEEEYDGVNSLQREAISPRTFELSGVKPQFGYEAPGCSVTVIRVHTK